MGPGSQLQVVVVDDDDDLRRFVSLALDLDGRFEIVGSAATAKAGVREVERLRPDAELLDLTLPDVAPDRGLDVVTEIRELVPRGAVVVFTGREHEHLDERVHAAGGTALVTKGDCPSAFIAALLCAPRLVPGTAVAVRSTFSGEWREGFFVAGEDESGSAGGWIRTVGHGASPASPAGGSSGLACLRSGRLLR